MKLEDIIVDERDDFFIINKPAGLVVHYSHTNPHISTLSTLLQGKVEDDKSGRAGIVHRLDKDTSGLMVIAKNIAFKEHMVNQFKNRLVQKRYIGLVHGRIEHPQALIELPIGRDPIKRHRMKVLSNGKSAKTKYALISTNHKYSLLDLNLLTGRTHQIRLHLSHLKHPIVGDSIYAPNQEVVLNRYFLQSYYLSFQDLNHQNYSISIDLDNSLKDFLKDHDITFKMPRYR